MARRRFPCVKPEDLQVRAVPGGVTYSLRGGPAQFQPGLSVGDVVVMDGGVYLKRLPDGAVIAPLESADDIRAGLLRTVARK